MIMFSPIASQKIQCTYRNETDRFQVVKIEGIERVIAAGQMFNFEAHEGSRLDIYSYELVTMSLSDRIPCNQLVS
jgi:hypothetical protein